MGREMKTEDARELIRGFDLERVREAIKTDKNHANTNFYLKSYWSLLKLAENTSDDPNHIGLRALSLATYGWIPTIPKRDNFERFQCNTPVQSIKAIGTRSEAEEFIGNMCKDAPINYSWIGTSKLLHFLSPDAFPIWDRKIAQHFDLSNSQYNKLERYIEYTQFMHTQVAKVGNSFDEMVGLINSQYGYKPCKMRYLEFYLFTMSD